MAGHGPAPKLPEQRRTRHVPQRGEWVELPLVAHGVPALPPGEWSRECVEDWNGWWSDRASTQWGPADVRSVARLLGLVRDFEVGGRGTAALPGEIRQRLDGLGLTQKGKRDLRWLVVEVEEETVPERPVKSRRRTLNVVA